MGGKDAVIDFFSWNSLVALVPFFVILAFLVDPSKCLYIRHTWSGIMVSVCVFL